MTNRFDGRKAYSVFISMALSIMLQNLGFGTLIFCMPLLLTCQGMQKTSHAVISFAVVALVLTAITLYRWMNVNLGMCIMGIVFPLMACVGCAVWVGLREFSDSVLRKLVICSFATGFIGLCYVIWLMSGKGSVQAQSLLEVFKQILPAEILGQAEDTFGEIVFQVMLLMMIPFGMLFSGFQILMSEFIIHRHDEQWQYNFAYMKMPNYYVWIFVFTWISALAGNFIDAVPQIVTVIGCNLAVGISLHYFMGGVSILTSLFRRHSASLTAGRVFFPVFIGCLIPGVNVAVLIGLTVLGVLETWIKFR